MTNQKVLKTNMLEVLTFIIVFGFFPIGFWLLPLMREEIKKIERRILVFMFFAISIFSISFYSMVFGQLNYSLSNIFTALQSGGLLSSVFWFTRMPILANSENKFTIRFGVYALCFCTDICILSILYVIDKFFLIKIYNLETLLLKNMAVFTALIAWNVLMVMVNKKYPRS